MTARWQIVDQRAGTWPALYRVRITDDGCLIVTAGRWQFDRRTVVPLRAANVGEYGNRRRWSDRNDNGIGNVAERFAGWSSKIVDPQAGDPSP